MQNRNHAAHAAAPRAPRRRAARGVAALGLTAGLLVPMGIAGADTAFASEPGESGNPDAGEAASLQEGSGQAPLTLDDAADRLAEAQGAYDQAEQRLAEEESQAQTAQAAQAAPGDAEGPAAGSAQLAQAGAEAQGAEPTSESAEPTEGGRAGAPNAAAAAGIDATQEAPSAAQGAQGDAEAEAVAETEPAAASAGAKAQAAAQEADGAKQPAAGADAAVPAANGAKQTAEARTNAPAAGDAPTPAGAAATAGLTAEQAQARYDQGAFAFYESVGADAALDILENCAYAGYVDRGGEASATSLANMLAAVEQLRELNALRASAGLPEYKVTYELLAMAQAQADYVAQRFEHNGQFLEQASNLYWGNAENIAAHTDDPQQGWYHAEKRAWDEAVAKNPALAKMSAVEVYKAYPDLYARTGHYLNTVADFQLAAIALNSSSSAWAEEFGYRDPSGAGMTVNEYASALEAYVAALRAAIGAPAAPGQGAQAGGSPAAGQGDAGGGVDAAQAGRDQALEDLAIAQADYAVAQSLAQASPARGDEQPAASVRALPQTGDDAAPLAGFAALAAAASALAVALRRRLKAIR